jgi:hypothetical protein
MICVHLVKNKLIPSQDLKKFHSLLSVSHTLRKLEALENTVMCESYLMIFFFISKVEPAHFCLLLMLSTDFQ